MLRLRPCLLAGLLLATPVGLIAADYVGPTGGDYNTPGYWTGGAVPTDTNVRITNGRTTILSTAAPDITNVDVQAAGSTLQVNTDGVLSATGDVFVRGGGNIVLDGTGRFRMAGSGKQFYLGSDWTAAGLGVHAFSNLPTDGLFSFDPTTALQLGVYAQNGSLTIDGTSDPLTIRRLELADDYSNNASTVGRLDVAGGAVTVTEGVQMGGEGYGLIDLTAGGVLTVSGGGINFGTNNTGTQVSRLTIDATSEFRLTAQDTMLYLSAADWTPSGTGTYRFSNIGQAGFFSMHASTGIQLGYNGRSAAMTIDGNSDPFSIKRLTFADSGGNNPQTTGRLDLQGGALTVTETFQMGGEGYGTLAISGGGVLNFSGGSAAFYTNGDGSQASVLTIDATSQFQMSGENSMMYLSGMNWTSAGSGAYRYSNIPQEGFFSLHQTAGIQLGINGRSASMTIDENSDPLTIKRITFADSGWNGPDTKGTLNVDGGTVTVTETFQMGGEGYGELNLTNGGVFAVGGGSAAFYTNGDGSQASRLTIDETSQFQMPGENTMLYLGGMNWTPSGSGAFRYSNTPQAGFFSLDDSAGIQLGINGRNASLTIDENSDPLTIKRITFADSGWNGPDTKGTLNVDGGTVTVTETFQMGGEGYGELNLTNGGVFTVQGGSAAFYANGDGSRVSRLTIDETSQFRLAGQDTMLYLGGVDWTVAGSGPLRYSNTPQAGFFSLAQSAGIQLGINGRNASVTIDENSDPLTIKRITFADSGWNGPETRGRLNVDGGTVTVTETFQMGGEGYGELNLTNGGVFTYSGTSAAFYSNGDGTRGPALAIDQTSEFRITAANTNVYVAGADWTGDDTLRYSNTPQPGFMSMPASTLVQLGINGRSAALTIGPDSDPLTLRKIDFATSGWNNSDTVGTLNVAGGSLTVSQGMSLGGEGYGRVNLSAGGVVTTSSATLLTAGTNQSHVRGAGEFKVTGALDMRGRVVADGGDLAVSFGSLADGAVPASATQGWYAVNNGRLSLPKLNVTGSAVNWGEAAADTSLDLVNSVRLRNWSGVQAGKLEVVLAAPETAAGTGLVDPVGIWSMTTSNGLSFTTVDLSFRYDAVAASAFVNDLRLWRNDGAGWMEIETAQRNEATLTFSATVDSFTAATFALATYAQGAAVTRTWYGDGLTEGGSGTWSATGSNWSNGSSVAPLPAGARAAFSFPDGTVTIDQAGVAATAGLVFEAGTAYEMNGGTLTLAGADAATNTVTVQSASTATIAAALAGTAGLTKAGPGDLVLAAAGTLGGAATVQEGTLRLGHGGALAAASVTVAGGTLATGVTTTLGGLAVNGGRVLLDSNETHDVDVGTFTIDSQAGLVDVGVSRIEVAGSADGAALRAAILAGGATTGWNGTEGILSSAAATSGGTRTVGYRVAGDGAAIFGFAAPGDTDLDGVVNTLDLVAISAGGKYGTGAAAVWAEGDFNYDGVVNSLDLVAIASSGVWGTGNYLPLPVAPSAVPEPATGLMLAAGAGGLIILRRCWRRRSGPGRPRPYPSGSRVAVFGVDLGRECVLSGVRP